MDNVITAGGVIIKLENNEKKILLVEDKYGLYFPKGHVEIGESLEQAAVREVREETGLSKLEIVRKLGVVTRDAGGKEEQGRKKDIHLFLMKAKDNVQGKAGERYGWFPIAEAISKMTFKEEGDFLEEIKGKI